MPTMRALSVDDSKMMRVILDKALHDIGYEVAEAADGHEALAQLNQGEPVDLMLVDWNMPVMSGYDLLRAVRAETRFNPVHILMLTVEGSMLEIEQALAAGADDYMTKPFRPEELREKLVLR
jgi:two-component system chemotaxis response regulator CheY